MPLPKHLINEIMCYATTGKTMDKNYQMEHGEMNRDDWEFEYTAAKLAEAAQKQYDFRLSRIIVWEAEKKEVMAKIKEGGIEVHESVADGMSNFTSNKSGYGPQVVIDPMMQRDLNECAAKIAQHRQAATAYEGWVQVLTANPETRLKLKHNDWMFFFGK